MTSLLATSPSEYTTNTDETDALALDVSADLTSPEAVTDAACELRSSYARIDVSSTGLPVVATVASNVVTQHFDARVLEPGHYDLIWNVTLNTGAVRSYRTTLKVEDHD